MVLELSKLPVNGTGKIESIGRNSMLRRRLQDLGFVPGTEITALFQGCCGGIRAYAVYDSVIALRNKDAAAVKVRI